MTAPVRVRESALRRVAYAVLARAVRGRRERGGEWGEAALAEFGETRGDWEAVRWAAGGLRTVWRERRRRARELPRPLRFARGTVLVLVVGLLAGVVVSRYVMSVGYIPSGSMEPTLQISDRVLLDRITFRATGLRRGDLVAFTKAIEPGARAHTNLKRVIGLPGDTIECRDGRVWRDGSPLDEPYLTLGPEEDRTDCSPVTVPEHQLYLLGDHRIVSIDSREYGTVDEDTVEARVVGRIWPIRD
ncbi:signal peptidase I [Actinoplanes sp. NPDC049316]|uniref:signal peptidase I n=1 Tax=Actinoplanes sp. NPDC049316 TaxID=3154727 RepID=UPI003437A722